MRSTMIRVRSDLHALLQELAEQEGLSMQEVLGQALEDYQRRQFFARTNDAFLALRRDPDAWQHELEEREAWDGTLLDDIEQEERVAVPH